MKFDPYDYIGVILPGSAVLFAAMVAEPEFRGLFGKSGIDVAGLGLFLIMSFVTGHIVQSLGNLIETALKRLPGANPADEVLSKAQKIIAPEQRAKLAEKLKTEMSVDLDGMDSASWVAIRRQMYASLGKGMPRERLESFNRTYGMLRGMSAALLLIAGGVIVLRPSSWAFAVVAVACSLATGARMVRFSATYMRELIVQYLIAVKPGNRAVKEKAARPKTAVSAPERE